MGVSEGGERPPSVQGSGRGREVSGSWGGGFHSLTPSSTLERLQGSEKGCVVGVGRGDSLFFCFS